MRGAVAVDFGATSGRFAAGWLEDGLIRFEVIEQMPHGAEEHKGKLFWNIVDILNLTKRAAKYAEDRFEEPTVGIDTWGVDHGFLDKDGKLLQSPFCYRDTANIAAF